MLVISRQHYGRYARIHFRAFAVVVVVVAVESTIISEEKVSFSTQTINTHLCVTGTEMGHGGNEEGEGIKAGYDEGQPGISQVLGSTRLVRRSYEKAIVYE